MSADNELFIPDGWRESQVRALKDQLKAVDSKMALLREQRGNIVARINGLTVAEVEEG